MRLAFEFKQPNFVGLMTGRPSTGMTHRQYLTWHTWIRAQWNEPDRSDWYIMQLTSLVASYMAQKEIHPHECTVNHEWKLKQLTQSISKLDSDMAEIRTMAALGIRWDLN